MVATEELAFVNDTVTEGSWPGKTGSTNELVGAAVVGIAVGAAVGAEVTTHVVASALGASPGPQVRHDEAPETVWYWFPVHGKHAAVALAGACVPGAHGVHAAAPVAFRVDRPGTQLVHTDAIAAEKVPTPHVVHEVALLTPLNVPAGQNVGSSDPVILIKNPGELAWQTEDPEPIA